MKLLFFFRTSIPCIVSMKGHEHSTLQYLELPTPTRTRLDFPDSGLWPPKWRMASGSGWVRWSLIQSPNGWTRLRVKEDLVVEFLDQNLPKWNKFGIGKSGFKIPGNMPDFFRFANWIVIQLFVPLHYEIVQIGFWGFLPLKRLVNGHGMMVKHETFTILFLWCFVLCVFFAFEVQATQKNKRSVSQAFFRWKDWRHGIAWSHDSTLNWLDLLKMGCPTGS